MWLVSSRRQGKLTQRPAPDPKCKLHISSFVTLPHLLDCLISTRNSVPIVLLLQMMRAWDRSGEFYSYQGVGRATAGGYYLKVFLFYLYFCLLLSHFLSLFYLSRA